MRLNCKKCYVCRKTYDSALVKRDLLIPVLNVLVEKKSLCWGVFWVSRISNYHIWFIFNILYTLSVLKVEPNVKLDIFFWHSSKSLISSILCRISLSLPVSAIHSSSLQGSPDAFIFYFFLSFGSTNKMTFVLSRHTPSGLRRWQVIIIAPRNENSD